MYTTVKEAITRLAAIVPPFPLLDLAILILRSGEQLMVPVPPASHFLRMRSAITLDGLDNLAWLARPIMTWSTARVIFVTARQRFLAVDTADRRH